jgi:hypothetical protein
MVDAGDAHDGKRSKLTATSDVAEAAQRNILQLILQYVGAKDWFFVAGVSKLWQQVYRGICEDCARQQKSWALKYGQRSYVGPVRATRTSYCNAFASLARLQLACDFDLRLSCVERLSVQDHAAQMVGMATFKDLPLQAGRYADKQTLLWAREQGLPWSEAVCSGAAE